MKNSAATTEPSGSTNDTSRSGPACMLRGRSYDCVELGAAFVGSVVQQRPKSTSTRASASATVKPVSRSRTGE